MKHRYLLPLLRLLVCLSLFCALPACVSHWTVQSLQDLNPSAEVIESCVRDPTVPKNVGAWGHSVISRQSVSDRDPNAFKHFAKSADYLYRYDPNAPSQFSQLPWPYHHMTCETVSSDAPPLPNGLYALPISHAMREAMVASLSQPIGAESSSLTAEFASRSWDKRLIAQMQPIGGNIRPVTPAQIQELGQMFRDAIRGVLPTVPRENVVGPHDDQISVIDTKTGQIIGGVGAGLPALRPRLPPSG